MFSFHATGKLANALVYFGWKGLDVVRSYVIPTNPKTTAQNTQRGYLTAAVAAIHAAEILAAHLLTSVDKAAYALYASCANTPRTWFNQMAKAWVYAAAHGEHPQILGAGTFTDVGAGATTLVLWNYTLPTEPGFIWCGVSKTAMLTSVAATGVANVHTGAFTGLTKGVEYFYQFRPTKVTDDKYCARSGIYHHVQLN